MTDRTQVPEILTEAAKTGALVYTLFHNSIETFAGRVTPTEARVCAIGGIVGGLRVILNEIEKDMSADEVMFLRDEIVCKLYPPSKEKQN